MHALNSFSVSCPPLQVDHAGTSSSLEVAREELRAATSRHNAVVQECSAAKAQAFDNTFDRVAAAAKVATLTTTAHTAEAQCELLRAQLHEERERNARLLATHMSRPTSAVHSDGCVVPLPPLSQPPNSTRPMSARTPRASATDDIEHDFTF